MIGTVGLVVGAVAATLFCALYHLSARWWRSEEGWHLMSFTGAMALVFNFVAIRTLAVPPRPVSLGLGITRAVIYCTVAALLLWRLWLLYRVQIRPGMKRERSRQ
ncbi:putative phage holin [Spirillospora sp. CA-253888]